MGGLNNGGKGYYALDVTDPLAPKGLWEFKWSSAVCSWSAGTTPIGAAVGNTSDCHLGQTFGRPLITKLADGTWVVMVTSGYNNVNAPVQPGDGRRLPLRAQRLHRRRSSTRSPTSAGDPTTPSGLAQINNFVDNAEVNNMTLRVYGTDVLGNIWRFDVNDNTHPGDGKRRCSARRRTAAGRRSRSRSGRSSAQADGKPMVFVGTGRLLGASDVGDLQTQSIYGIVDPLTGTPAFPNLRTRARAAHPYAGRQRSRHLPGPSPAPARPRSAPRPTAGCVDLPDAGERVNVEMKLRSGTLIVGSNVPQISACVERRLQLAELLQLP